jgi:hypothetical protein
MVQAGTSVGEEDGGTPVEHTLDEDPFARPRRTRTVDFEGPDNGDRLDAVE